MLDHGLKLDSGFQREFTTNISQLLLVDGDIFSQLLEIYHKCTNEEHNISLYFLCDVVRLAKISFFL